MTIRKERFGDVMDVTLEGRLDTLSSPLLEQELEQSYSGLHELRIDLGGLEYISSAGLRVLLGAQRKMNRFGSLIVFGAKCQVMDALETTGFARIMM